MYVIGFCYIQEGFAYFIKVLLSCNYYLVQKAQFSHPKTDLLPHTGWINKSLEFKKGLRSTRSEYCDLCIIKLSRKMDATPSFGVTMISEMPSNPRLTLNSRRVPKPGTLKTFCVESYFNYHNLLFKKIIVATWFSYKFKFFPIDNNQLNSGCHLMCSLFQFNCCPRMKLIDDAYC